MNTGMHRHTENVFSMTSCQVSLSRCSSNIPVCKHLHLQSVMLLQPSEVRVGEHANMTNDAVFSTQQFFWPLLSYATCKSNKAPPQIRTSSVFSLATWSASLHRGLHKEPVSAADTLSSALKAQRTVPCLQRDAKLSSVDLHPRLRTASSLLPTFTL